MHRLCFLIRLESVQQQKSLILKISEVYGCHRVHILYPYNFYKLQGSGVYTSFRFTKGCSVQKNLSKQKRKNVTQTMTKKKKLKNE